MIKNIKVIFDRRKTFEKTGKGTIDICIYLKEGERKFESVAQSTPEKWEAMVQSKDIQAKLMHYEHIINAMTVLGEDMTIENFNSHINQATSDKPEDPTLMFKGTDLRQSFVEFCRNHMQDEDLAKNSIKNFNVVFDSLEESGILNTFADLTPTNVRAYDAWLRKPKNRTDYTINGYHKKVHKYTKILWQMEMIASDPYDYVSFPKGSNKERNPLTEEEIIKIRDAKLTGYKDRARDLFIFMAYTGLAYCDVCLFDFETMTEKYGNCYYIDGERLKTGSKFFTPILPPAMAVLEKYDFKLPYMANQRVNDYLHIVQEKLDITKSVTCHIGRHSFATLMLSYDIPIEKVKRMLGHKNIATTQIYAKILKKNVERSVSEMLPTLR